MKSFLFRNNIRLLFEVFLIVFVGFLVAQAVLQTSAMEAKWSKALLLGLIGLTGLIVLPDKEKFLLYFAAFLLPIGLSFHPVYIERDFYRAVDGFEIKAFDFPLALILLFWAIRLIRTRERVQLHLWITLPYLVIFGLCVASLPLVTAHPAIKAGTLLLVLKNPFIFLYLANNLSNRRTVFVLIGVLLMSGALQGLISIAQYLKGGPLGLGMLGEMDSLRASKAGSESITRMGGTVGHPNKLALMLAFLLEINFAVLFIHAPKWLKRLRVLPLLLMLPALILTYSRSAWASLILGGTLNVYWCRAKKTQQKVISAFLVVTVFSVVAFSAVGFIPSVRNRIFGDDDGSGSDIRVQLKIIAKNIIHHHYWRGVGLNNYTSVIRKYDNSPEGASWGFPMPVHNEYLLVAVELGVPAAVIFVILLVIIFFLHVSIGLTSKEKDPEYPYLAIGFLCGWIGWAFHHRTLYEYVFFQHDIWFYLGIALALKNNLKTDKSVVSESEER
ncbi:MAG: O-antigen ligase family protein [Candidatus Electrothrix sp. ATG1]|nr:O-antigen ligase family protein [Candidatus Electrothrix sp. ATG1]